MKVYAVIWYEEGVRKISWTYATRDDAIADPAFKTPGAVLVSWMVQIELTALQHEEGWG